MMSSISSRLKDIETRAQSAEKNVGAKSSHHAQLEAAINSAELYMQALRLATNPVDKKRLDTKTKELISRAEILKRQKDEHGSKPARRDVDMHYPTSTRKLSTRENIILLEGSKLNGTTFKPWKDTPKLTEFDLAPGQESFEDDSELPLSELQLKSFDGWRRPHDALSRIKLERDGKVLPNEPTMVLLSKIDLVQDVVSDCSVVASLCVGTARAEKGHQRMSGTMIHPFDFEQGEIAISKSGRYVFRLYFNGCWRRVEIDDRLPSSRSSRVLHVFDRSHPGLLWPAILEKAYLKVRGGYDFPGSNSGTDLAVITGWIPQQIFLHDEEVDSNSLWDEIMPLYSKGHLLMTLGTGKLGHREQKQLGLAAEHDYAVIDMKETSGIRELLIKNPWADGEIWKGAVRRRPNPGHEAEVVDSPQDAECQNMMPGTFWMDFQSVFQYFEHLYVNWNPALFSARQDLHFTWNIPEMIPIPNILIDNPQYSITPSKDGEIWLLLNRHFRTGDYTISNHGKNGYISLYLFDRNGIRVLASEGARIRGPFVDSPNTLLRFEAKSKVSYTVVAVCQDLPPGKHNFTLSAFANCAIDLNDAQHRYNSPQSVTAAWTRSTAAGNSESPRYLKNPQFKIVTTQDTPIALVLRLVADPTQRLNKTDIHVKTLIAASDGRRITKLRSRDIISHSGDYRRGNSVLETVVPKGNYSIVCSTFEQNQLARFQLDLYYSGSMPVMMVSLPSESSGRLIIHSAPAVFIPGINKLIAPVQIGRMTKAIFIANQLQGSGSALFKMSLQLGQGAYNQELSSSATDEAEYITVASGIRIEDMDLNISMSGSNSGQLWVVLERPSQSSSQLAEPQVLQVEILAEERVELGAWAPVED